MRSINRIIVWSSIMTVMALLAISSPASAQTASAQSITPDTRYAGYTGIAIKWPTSIPNILACVDGEYYTPSSFELRKYKDQIKNTHVENQVGDKCRWVAALGGWGYKLFKDGTPIVKSGKVVGEGVDLFIDDCYNPSPLAFDVVPTPEPAIIEPRVELVQRPTPVQQLVVPRIVATPAQQSAVAPAAPPESLKTPSDWVAWPRFSFGVDFGSVSSHWLAQYLEAIPNSGDVNQNHDAENHLVMFDGSAQIMNFLEVNAEGTMTTSGHVSNVTFDDIHGPVTKNRVDIGSMNRYRDLRVGAAYFVRNDRAMVKIGGFVGHNQYTYDQEYTGQGATSSDKLTFSGGSLGLNASVTVDFDSNRRFGVKLAVSKAWANSDDRWRQYKQSAPGVTLPPVGDTHDAATMEIARIDVRVKLFKYAEVGVLRNSFNIDSARPNTYNAKEQIAVSPNRPTIFIGGRISF